MEPTNSSHSSLRAACMEDVHSAVLAAFSRLEELKVLDGNDPKHDVLYEQMTEVLERYFNFPDYSNYN